MDNSTGADAKADAGFWFKMGSLGLCVLGMLVALGFGLLPLLLGLLSARAASLALASSGWLVKKGPGAKVVASVAVGALAAALLAGGVAWMFKSGVQAVKEAPALAQKLTAEAQRWRLMLPSYLADQIPVDDQEIQDGVAAAIGQQMPSIAGAGRAGLSGALFALIGWIIGLVMANVKPQDSLSGPLARALRERGSRFAEVFNQIVVGQFIVSCANTAFAAIYLFVLLPLAGISMPWAPALVAMTTVLSMIPAAGNVLCNGVVTLVALSVGPGVALASLGYLIVVHKLEYFINAKAVGRRANVSVWELLLAMFVLEAVFGVGGLVAAPLFYAYLKSELKSLGWV